MSGVLCAVFAACAWTPPAQAQIAEIKAKPPMYTYVANWTIPRARWADMGKADAADQKVMDNAVAGGAIIGYGSDTNLIHTLDGGTHDTWWSGMSMASVLNTLDALYKSGSATSPVLSSATKHWDNLYVSRFYNWRSGSWKGAYGHAASYKLKADAPDDAIELLSKNAMVPLLEKLLADGTIVEYEIDIEAVHTESPGTFVVYYVSPNAEGLDRFDAALRETLDHDPLVGPAFGSMVDFTPHRDSLVRATLTYK